jgi:hypothetical protein
MQKAEEEENARWAAMSDDQRRRIEEAREKKEAKKAKKNAKIGAQMAEYHREQERMRIYLQEERRMERESREDP